MLSRGHIYINIPHPDKKHYIIQKSLFFNSLQEKKIRGGGGKICRHKTVFYRGTRLGYVKSIPLIG